MKRSSSGVIGAVHSFFERNSKVACAITSVTSIYLTAFCFNWYQASRTAVIVGQEASAPSPVNPVTQEDPTPRHQVRVVSEIIQRELPSHPDRDSLAELIVSESRKADIDPLLVAAVVRAESRFKPKAISNRGARGLMQLMPQTGMYMSKSLNIKINGASDLHDPATNLRLGISYLKHLNKLFPGNRKHVLIAYNWGPTNLARSLRGKGTPPSQSEVYAREVLSHHQQWSASYEQRVSDRSTTSFG